MTLKCLDCYPLHDAVIHNDLDALKGFLESGEYNPDKRDVFMSSPLHVATILGNTKAVNLLLENGANPDVEGAYGKTPLIYACEKSNYNIAKLLIEVNANVNMIDDNGVTPIEISLNNLEANQDDHFKVINDLKMLTLMGQNDGEMFIENSDDQFTINLPVAYILKLFGNFCGDAQLAKLYYQAADSFTDGTNLVESYIAAKYLFHVFANGNVYPFIANDNIYMFHTEGSVMYTYDVLNQSIESFLTKNIGGADIDLIFTNMAGHFTDATILKNSFSKVQADTICQRYEQGETILLHSGWQGHAIDIIFSPTQHLMIVCNSGQRAELNPGGAKYYELSENFTLTAKDIYDIATNLEQSDLEMEFLYKNGLKLVDIQAFDDQSWGNCEYYSQTIAVRELLRLEFKQAGYADDALDDITNKWFDTWSEHNKTFAIEHYLAQDVDLLPYEAITDLLRMNNNPSDENDVTNAKLLIEYLSEGIYQDEWQETLQTAPLKWLKYHDILEACEVDFKTGKLPEPLKLSDVISNDTTDGILTPVDDIEPLNEAVSAPTDALIVYQGDNVLPWHELVHEAM